MANILKAEENEREKSEFISFKAETKRKEIINIEIQMSKDPEMFKRQNF